MCAGSWMHKVSSEGNAFLKAVSVVINIVLRSTSIVNHIGSTTKAMYPDRRDRARFTLGGLYSNLERSAHRRVSTSLPGV